ncbi:MAG: MFS transporter [Spirochaetales bacterium]|nr:MAG: MFS transporter [Spirochaetales bacterium]
MEKQAVKVYGYRWIIMAAFMILNVIIQIHWVALAAITGEAAAFYSVSPLSIGFLSMIYMLVYIVMCIPASYVIDTYGLRVGIGIGALLAGVFGFLKGMFAADYTMIVIAQLGLAVAQPFILNAYTKLAAQWFPVDERATVSGLASLAQYLGIIVALGVSPFLFAAKGMEGMLMIYGIITLAGSAIFLLIIRERPPTPPGTDESMERYPFFAGLRHIMGLRDMRLLLVLFFIGLGIFNAVTTWIEQILAPRGITPEQAGIIGAIMMIGGILGASILPVLSDKTRKRRPFLVGAMIAMVPGLFGLAFATQFWLILASSFVLGFFIMSAGPIGFQYSAEVSHPAPESISQGVLLLAGQISGVIFIFGMDAFRSGDSGSMTPFLVLFMALVVGNALLGLKLRESKIGGA